MATTGPLCPKKAPKACVYFVFDVQPIRSGEPERMHCPHWLLALTIPFSRSDRAHTCSPVLMPGARRTVPDEKLSPESLLRLPEGRGGRSDGCVTLSDTRPRVNASERAEFRRINTPGSAYEVNSTGHPVSNRGPVAAQAGWRDTARWHAKNQTPALRMPPRCSGPNWLSVPLALRSGSPYEDVRCPLTSSTYRVSQTCVTRSSPPVVARP